MPREDLLQRAVEWVEAFNNADWQRHEESYAPRLTYNLLPEVTPGFESTAGAATRFTEREEVVAVWKKIKDGSPDLIIGSPDSWIVDEGKDTVLGFVTWSGTDLTSGKQTKIPGALVFSAPIDEHGVRRITQVLEYGNWHICPLCRRR